MLTATSKHLSVIKGLAKFAMVTVGQLETNDDLGNISEPQILLNGHPVKPLNTEDRALIEAVCRGMREEESDLGWQGQQHQVISIEGLTVDGIDAEAAYLAARKATKELIEAPTS